MARLGEIRVEFKMPLRTIGFCLSFDQFEIIIAGIYVYYNSIGIALNGK